MIGFTAGTLASCCNIPFDVAKSRIQGPQPEPGKVKYRGTFRDDSHWAALSIYLLFWVCKSYAQQPKKYRYRLE